MIDEAVSKLINAGTPSRKRLRGQRGMAAGLELAILVPAFMIMLGLIVAGGRIWFVRTAIVEASYSGARAASLERSAAEARTAGRQATIDQLAMKDVRCTDREIRLDVSGFDAPIGSQASVTNEVRCRISFGDVVLPGIGGSLRLAGWSRAAIDSYRER
jgi:Flp pilus assembly protein TadG